MAAEGRIRGAGAGRSRVHGLHLVIDRTHTRRGAAVCLFGALVFLTACSGEHLHVEVLASVRADAPGQAWSSESSDFRALSSVAFAPGRRVVVMPVSDASATERPLLDESIPGESVVGKNSRQLRDMASADRLAAERALGDLSRRTDGRQRTEIIAAINGAGERFLDDGPGTKKYLLILTTGYEQSSIVNMADVGLDLRQATWPLIRRLTRTGAMPNLRGVDVCMGSVTSGLGAWADTPQYRRIHAFWRAFFAQSGARLVSYGPYLSKTCIRSES